MDGDGIRLIFRGSAASPMDGSNSGGKKIVFKNRFQAPKQDELPDLSLEPEVAAEESRKEPEQNLQYEGDVFDQFYRPLSVHGGIERLIEIAREPSPPLAVPPRLTKAQSVECDRIQQELAEALAHQMYHLAQQLREGELDVYLSAINVVIGDKSSQEGKKILDKANDFFTEHYYTIIRDRGERPEIYHQIIKRVGHEAAERIAKIVGGFDPGQTARSIWDLQHGLDPDKSTKITDILMDCTEKQVRALREEFLLMPYKHLAKQVYAILNHQSGEPTMPTRRSIGKTEMYEQKKQSAFRARDDIRALRYLLLGRSSEELALINRFYCDFGDPDASESDINIEAHVRRILSQAEFDRVSNLFSGWSPYDEAAALHNLIYPQTLGSEIEDQLSDPREMVDRDHTQGLGPFLRRFKKSRMWRDKDSVYHHILNQFELVEERIAAMSAERFLATNDALREVYGYELDPTLFPSLALFDARRVAVLLHERISRCGDFFEIIQPIQFLDPQRCVQVQRAFEILFGKNLLELVQQRIVQLSGKQAALELPSLIERYVHGQGRWPLNSDILARYRGDEPLPGVWQPDFKNYDTDEATAIQLAQVLDQESNIGDLDRPIMEMLFDRSYDELNRIERAFFDLTEPHMPLREALHKCMSHDAFGALDALLGGVRTQEIVAHIHDDPSSAVSLKEFPAPYIKTVREAFKRSYFMELEEFIWQQIGSSYDEDTMIEVLSVVLLPEVYEARGVLQRLRRESLQELEGLRKNWSGRLVRILAFELAYDMTFPRLRLHLKLLAARQVLSPHAFAEIVLCLEGIDPEVNQRILECFDAVDINSLLEILRANKRDQKIIEETYDLLNPEAQLRRSVQEMKVDLDIINETLLHIEGFSAQDVAVELHDIIEKLNGEELGLVVNDLLAAPTAGKPNKRIPQDINWMDEMVFQVALAYQRMYRAELIASCRKRGVGQQQIEDLTSRVFGMEVCASARDIFSILKMHKEGLVPPDFSEQRVCSYLESRGARHRDRLMRAYNSFWAHTPGYESLIDDITKFFKDTVSKKKMVAMLLGAGGDSKAATANPVVLH